MLSKLEKQDTKSTTKLCQDKVSTFSYSSRKLWRISLNYFSVNK
ncbi:hypothetical protein LEMLEM_LOCUS3980 [Lemmus lemmus]